MKPPLLKELTELIEKHSSLIEKPQIPDQIDGSASETPKNLIKESLGRLKNFMKIYVIM
jgi:hypothetical protein